MTSERYTNILEGHLLPTALSFYKADLILQQDNGLEHKARHSQRWFVDNVTVLDWPSYSPNLFIENIWEIIKESINQKCLTNIEGMKAEIVSY